MTKRPDCPVSSASKLFCFLHSLKDQVDSFSLPAIDLGPRNKKADWVFSLWQGQYVIALHHLPRCDRDVGGDACHG